MARVFDEADYKRRLLALEANDDVSLGQEIGFALSGDEAGLNARKDINLVKAEALRTARKEMVRAIRAAQEYALADAVIPLDVTETAFGKSDDLVKVP